jgi:hypothetical protein
MTALMRTAPMRDYVILETSDAQLVRKLHAMRASRATFEYQAARWTITRIMLLPASTSHPSPTWEVSGHACIASRRLDAGISRQVDATMCDSSPRHRGGGWGTMMSGRGDGVDHPL